MVGQEHDQGLAIITGASRGIGAEYARRLAARGFSLLLIARDEDRLQKLCQEIKNTHGIEIFIHCLDLSREGAAQELFNTAQQCSKPVDLLINNAGFGLYGEFVNMPLPRIQEMLQLHITTVVESTRLFLPSMIERQFGAIINVASVAGFLPIPFMTEYSATKAFLISFSEALAEEVRESGVTIQACCPGYTKTDFHKEAGHQPRNPFPPQSVQEVVQTSLRALEGRRTRVTIGWQGWLSDLVTKYLPRNSVIRLSGRRVKPPT